MDHGMEEATYVSDGHSYQPFVICLCGWESGRCASWQDAGKELDDHIAAERLQQLIRRENEQSKS